MYPQIHSEVLAVVQVRLMVLSWSWGKGVEPEFHLTFVASNASQFYLLLSGLGKRL